MLCNDTVPKYRVKNGAGERGTVRTINIHSPSTEKAGKSTVHGEIFSSHELCLVAPLGYTGFVFMVPHFQNWMCWTVEVLVLF